MGLLHQKTRTSEDLEGGKRKKGKEILRREKIYVPSLFLFRALNRPRQYLAIKICILESTSPILKYKIRNRGGSALSGAEETTSPLCTAYLGAFTASGVGVNFTPCAGKFNTYKGKLEAVQHGYHKDPQHEHYHSYHSCNQLSLDTLS